MKPPHTGARPRPWWLGVLPAMALTVGCVFGARGEREFVQSWPVAGVSTIRVALPDTPLPVTGCDPAFPEVCPELLHVDGRWLSVAGTKADAREDTARGELDFAEHEGFGQLTAVKDLAVQDLLDLDVFAIRMPGNKDLELVTGVGDVEVRGMEGAITVEIDAGDIDIIGGAGGIVAVTEVGHVTVETAGIVDAHTDEGHIDVVQSGSARDAYLRTELGDVRLVLSSDANLDVEIHANGRIDVETTTIRTVTHGFFQREVGNGTHRIRITTEFGDVLVQLRE